MRMREGFRSPVREYCTPGSLAGAAGNRRPYATYRNWWGYSTVGWFTRGAQGEITLREFSSPVPGKARFQEGPEKRTPCNLPQVSTGSCEVDYRGGVTAVTKREEW